MSAINYLSVPSAIEAATGQRPTPTTCWRWYTRGSKGVVLQTWMLGGRRVTTQEAVQDFIERRTKSALPTRPSAGKVRSELNRELGLSQ